MEKSFMRRCKRVLAMIIAVVLLIDMLPLGGWTVARAESTTDVWNGSDVADGFAGGDGSEESPYEIKTGAQLAFLAQEVNEDGSSDYHDDYYILMNDIDLNGKEWMPIGTNGSGDVNTQFIGNFNGNGYGISGLSITMPTEEYFGLFGYQTGTIEGLTVEGAIELEESGSDKKIGGLVGYNEGTIRDCDAKVDISIHLDNRGVDNTICNNDIGGLVGRNEGNVKDCNAENTVSILLEYAYNSEAGEGSIKKQVEDSNIGGLVGNNKRNLENCFAKTTISIQINISGQYNSNLYHSNIGGLVGNNEGSVKNCEAVVADSIQTGQSSSDSTQLDHSNIGGLVGINRGNMENCNVKITLKIISQSGGFNSHQLDQSGIGGLVGKNEGAIINCKVDGILFDVEINQTSCNDEIMIGGLAGSNDGNITGCGVTMEGSIIAFTGENSNFMFGGLVGYNANRINDENGIIKQCHTKGSLGVSNVFNNDSSIGSLAGCNEGAVNDCFSSVNLAVSDVNSTNKTIRVGGLVGYNVSKTEEGIALIENCYYKGNMTINFSGSQNKDAGGLVGGNNVENNVTNGSAIIERCYNEGKVNVNVSGMGLSYMCFGGITGSNGYDNNSGSGTILIKKCNNLGEVRTIYSNSSYSFYVQQCGTGGIAGFNRNSKVEECYNAGSIYAYVCIGGIAGYNADNVEIKNSYNTGDISSIQPYDSYTNFRSWTGGIVGYNLGGTNVTGCNNSGAISGNNDYIGGIIGFNYNNNEDLIVRECHNTGTINSSAGYVGGIIGCSDNYGKTISVINCYNTGDVVTSSKYLGGIAGQLNYGIIDQCYNTGYIKGSKELIGGLVGCNDEYGSGEITIQNSFNSGMVRGSNNIGGLIGSLGGSSSKIQNSFNIGAITSYSNNTGGIVGYNYNVDAISNCYNAGKVSGGNENVGGIIGYTYNSGGTLENCYNIGNVDGVSDTVGSIIGNNQYNNIIVNNCYYNQDIYKGKGISGSNSTDTTTPLTTEEMLNRSILENKMQSLGDAEDSDSNRIWMKRDTDLENRYYPELEIFGRHGDETIREISRMSVRADKNEVDVSEIRATDITYGEKLGGSEFYGTVKDLVTGEDVDGVVQWDNEEAIPTKMEGINGYPVAFTPEDDSYHTVKFIVPITVNPKGIDVTPKSNQTKVYGEDDPVIEYEVTGLIPADQGYEGGILRGALERVAGETVATYVINQGNLEANENYYINSFQSNIEFEILKATPNIILNTNPNSFADYGEDNVTVAVEVEESGHGEVPTGTVILESGGGETLGEEELDGNGKCSFTITLETGLHNLNIKYEGNDNYNNESCGLIYVVMRSDPDYSEQIPQNLTAFYGDALADVSLPSGWMWEDGTQVVGEVGQQTHYAKFIPTDTKNYNVVTGIELTINVVKANQTQPQYANHDPINKTYGEEPFGLPVVSGGESTGDYSYRSENASVATVDADGGVTIVGAGKTTIFVKKLGDAYYEDSIEDGIEVNIVKANQTQPQFASSSPIHKVYGEEPFNLPNVSGGESTGNYSYRSSKVDVATVNGLGQVTIVGAGKATIYVKRLGDTNFEDSDEDGIEVSVAKSNQAQLQYANQDPINKTYGVEPFDLPEVSGGNGTGGYSYRSTNEYVATVDDRGEVTIIGTGKATIYVKKLGDANYNDSSEDGIVVNVSKADQARPQYASKETINKTYGEEPFDLPNVSGGNGTGSYSYRSTNESVATVDVGGEVTIRGAGKATIYVKRLGDANYNESGEDEIEVNIAKANQTLPQYANHEDINKAYGEEPFKLPEVNGGNGTGSYSYRSANEDVAMVDIGGRVTIVGVGETTIYVKRLGDVNFNDSDEDGIDVNVGKADQPKPQYANHNAINKTYGEEPFYLPDVSGGKGTGSLNYRSTNESVATVDSSGRVTIVGTGKATIYVKRIGDKNYNDSIEDDIEVNVAKADHTELLYEDHSTINKVFGEEPFYLPDVIGGKGTGIYSYRSTNENVATVDADGRVTIVGAGKTSIYIKRLGDANYNDSNEDGVDVNVAKAEQTLPQYANRDPINKTYGGEPFDLPGVSGGESTGSYSYRSTNEYVAKVNTEGQVSIMGAGKATIYVKRLGDSNYMDSGEDGVEINVAKVGQTTPQFAIKDVITKTYGEEPFDLPGVCGGESTGNYSYRSTNEYVATVNEVGKVTIMGSGKATIFVKKLGDANYENSIEDGIEIIIAKADQTKPQFNIHDAINKTYGDGSFDMPNVSGGESAGNYSYRSGDENVAKVDDKGKVTITGAGRTTIYVKKLGDANYNDSEEDDVEVNVAKAIPLYSIPDNLIATYGDTLGDIILPDGWAWEEDGALDVGDVGEQFHKATFTPKDTNNYIIISGILIKINVSSVSTIEPPEETTAPPEETSSPPEETTAPPTQKTTASPTPTVIVNKPSTSPSIEPVTTVSPKVVKPKKIKTFTLKNKKKKTVLAKWKTKEKVSGYQIVYSTNKKFKKGKKTKLIKMKKKINIKKLKIGKTYYFKIRAYRLNGKKKVYGKFSKVKKVKIKK